MGGSGAEDLAGDVHRLHDVVLADASWHEEGFGPGDDHGDAGPKKDEVEDAEAVAAEVEVMDAEAAEEDREEDAGDLVLAGAFVFGVEPGALMVVHVDGVDGIGWVHGVGPLAGIYGEEGVRVPVGRKSISGSWSIASALSGWGMTKKLETTAKAQTGKEEVERGEGSWRMAFFGILPLRQAQGQDDSKNEFWGRPPRQVPRVVSLDKFRVRMTARAIATAGLRVSAAVHAEEAEEEAAEDGFYAEHEAGGGWQGKAEHALGGEVAEACAVPDVNGVAEDDKADEEEGGAEDEADFEVDVVEDALELWVGGQEAFLGAEDTGADSEDADVGSDEDEAEGVGEGVDVEGPAADGLRTGQKPERDEEAEEKS